MTTIIYSYLESDPENEKYIKDTLSSKDDEMFNELFEKTEEIQEKIKLIDDEILHLKENGHNSGRKYSDDHEKWRKRLEEYVNTLHFEIEEQNKLTKKFKHDVFEKLKSQRKATGELNQKVTTLFTNFKKLNPTSEKSQRNRQNLNNSI